MNKTPLKHAGKKVGDTAGAIVLIAAMGVGCVGGALAAREHYHENPITITRTIQVKAPDPITADEVDGIRSLVNDLKSTPGMNPVLIAAIAGNVYGESDGNSKALETSKKPKGIDLTDDNAVKTWALENKAGVGLLQWTADRASSYFDYVSADPSHRTWDDASLQTDFLKKELSDPSLWTTESSSFWNAADVASATKALEEGFIRPADPAGSLHRRTKAALDVYSAMQLGTL